MTENLLTEKICTKCKNLKLAEFFRNNNKVKSGLNSWCKECENDYRKSNYKPRIRKPNKGRNPNCKSLTKDYILNSHYKYKYSISLEIYRKMYDSQNGKCSICNDFKEMGGKKGLVIDHCHKTGEIRGLLCPSCNSAIGKLKEDPKIFISALEYLERNNKL